MCLGLKKLVFDCKRFCRPSSKHHSTSVWSLTFSIVLSNPDLFSNLQYGNLFQSPTFLTLVVEFCVCIELQCLLSHITLGESPPYIPHNDRGGEVKRGGERDLHAAAETAARRVVLHHVCGCVFEWVCNIYHTHTHTHAHTHTQISHNLVNLHERGGDRLDQRLGPALMPCDIHCVCVCVCVRACVFARARVYAIYISLDVIYKAYSVVRTYHTCKAFLFHERGEGWNREERLQCTYNISVSIYLSI